MIFQSCLAILQLKKWWQLEDEQYPLKEENYFNFSQLIDHFDNTNQNRFDQRYLKNETFYKAGGPLLVHIGGEGTLATRYLEGGYSISYHAEQLKGFAVALEHRYYGKSMPLGDLKDMRYLSSKQALADLAEFIPFVKQKYNLTDAKVVVLGGSYAGNLAGWARSQFPFLIDAAIATSGPTLGETIYPEYMAHVEEVLMQKGGDKCFERMRTGITEAIKLLKSDVSGFNQLFKAVSPASPTKLDIANIESAISNKLIHSTQYYNGSFYDNKTEKNSIQLICDEFFGELPEEATNEQILNAYAAKNDLSQFGDLSFAEQIRQLQNTTPGDGAGRSWTYQTCTEFGYYQITGETMFGDEQDINYYLQTCYDVFFKDLIIKQDPDLIETKKIVDELVDFTNQYYGARNQPRSHIYYTNGRIDPWSELSVVQGKTFKEGQWIHEDSTLKWIDDGSHCTDMYMRWASNDGVRLEQLNKLKEWLNM